jgi:hypothetical protein
MDSEPPLIEQLAQCVEALMRSRQSIHLRGREHGVTLPVAVEYVIASELSVGKLPENAAWRLLQGCDTVQVAAKHSRWRVVFGLPHASSEQAKALADLRIRAAAVVEDLLENRQPYTHETDEDADRRYDELSDIARRNLMPSFMTF